MPGAVAAVDDDWPLVGRLEQAGDVQERRLAGARWPDQRHGLARQKLGGGARQHDDLARALLEGAPEAVELQDRQ